MTIQNANEPVKYEIRDNPVCVSKVVWYPRVPNKRKYFIAYFRIFFFNGVAQFVTEAKLLRVLRNFSKKLRNLNIREKQNKSASLEVKTLNFF